MEQRPTICYLRVHKVHDALLHRGSTMVTLMSAARRTAPSDLPCTAGPHSARCTLARSPSQGSLQAFRCGLAPKQLSRHDCSLAAASGVANTAGGSEAPVPTTAAAAPSAASIREKIAGGGRSLRRFGWVSFWIQLPLTVVSAVILLFQMAFTQQVAPPASLYFSLGGLGLAIMSTAWTFGYISLGRKLGAYASGFANSNVEKVKKQYVLTQLFRGVLLSMWGLGMSLMALQSLVGSIVAKTLATSTANPFIPPSHNYSPVLALDVFLT